jgi:hypothetical protein
MAGPTHAQIAAVHRVLYNPARLKQLAEDFQQLNLLMNLDGPPLATDDSRIAVGDGPDWVVPATGAVDVSVLNAAATAERLAERLLGMRREISHVNCPAADRRRLMTALSEQAQAWSARASLWRETTAPDDVAGAVATITKHERAAGAALAHVQRYLRPASDFPPS